MAYNNYISPYVQPMIQNPQMQNQNFQPNFQQNYQQNQQQIQNGGFMVVPSEDMARTYPVAPGNCVTFKIEGKPIVMEKSMGFSQLEAPRIDRYRLVREEDAPKEQNLAPNSPNDNPANNEAYEKLKEQIKAQDEQIKDILERLEKVEDMGA